MTGIKFVAQDEIEGLAIPWGGPLGAGGLAGLDYQGQRFDPTRTDLHESMFTERPVMLEHGLGDAGAAVVGRVVKWWRTAQGVMARVKLDRGPYLQRIRDMVNRGAAFFSSAALGHLVRVDPDDTITSWPWAELTITKTPANPWATLDWATASKHFAMAGLDSSSLQAAMRTTGYDPHHNSLGALPHEFAFIDSAGRGHLPLHDRAHVRNAVARFNQTTFETGSQKRAAWTRIVAAARRFNVTLSSTTMPKSTDAGALMDTSELRRWGEDLLADFDQLRMKQDIETMMAGFYGPEPEAAARRLGVSLARLRAADLDWRLGRS